MRKLTAWQDMRLKALTAATRTGIGFSSFWKQRARVGATLSACPVLPSAFRDIIT